MAWTDRIDELVEERHLLKHPFYIAWTAGRLSLETLGAYAEQYYKHVAAFPRYLSAIHAQTADLKTRQYILDNLIDEERGGENHPELWLRFAEALGCSRDDVHAAVPLAETVSCDEAFQEICGRRGTVPGLAALYAYESMVPSVSVSKIEGLKRFYGIGSEGALRFFSVHVDIDHQHAAVARALLEDATPAGQDAALASVCEALDAINRLLDGIVRAHCPEVAA